MKDVAIITGSAGLIGAEATRFLLGKGFEVIGIDNDMRGQFFGGEASTEWARLALQQNAKYSHYHCDVRDRDRINNIFNKYGKNIEVVIHAAAQPSHDWAVNYPFDNFDINASATLNLLEATRTSAPDATFIFLSSNKVYGDHVNRFALQELPTRYDRVVITKGVDETMSIDGSMHSLYGASKAAADIMVQEYGRYYEMNTVCFRCGCLSGPGHSGTQMHGFLSYLMKCAVNGDRYEVIGYKGKQVRDHLHSQDVISAFWHFMNDPKSGEIYNLGGGRGNECSVIESVRLCEELTGRPMDWHYVDKPRRGDHKWWITDNGKFENHYLWKPTVDVRTTLIEIRDAMRERASIAA